jgi:hypothetical protein
MKLQYFRGNYPNFGDELNLWLWPQLLPNFLDSDPTVLFIGIGSILGSHYEDDAKKVVFGTGYVPNYHKLPDVHRADWDIFFVRGPRTARALGIDENLGIGDAAILLRALNFQSQREPRYIGFMPHWESMQRGGWQAACNLANVRLIDPCAHVDGIITEILGCEVLITEAMHGAIVADALRVPWIPMLPIDHAHREKWFDWADALNLKLLQHRLWPSNPTEVKLATRYRPFLSCFAECLSIQPVAHLSKPIITYIAAQRLTALAKVNPNLSADNVLEDAFQKMVEKLDKLQKKYRM